MSADARSLFDAVGELVLAIPVQHIDKKTKTRCAKALHTLLDHIIEHGGKHD